MSVVKDKNVNTANEEPAWSTYTSPRKMEGVMEYVAADSIVKYNVYRTRWLMLGLFVLYSSSNSMQWMQYTIIQDVIVKYYNVPSTLVSWTSMIYMITYVPLIFPGSWLLDKTGLRITTIIGSFGTCFGAWLKVFSVPQDMFWLGFTGQTVVAVSQVFILNVPPRLAAVWFGADQVSSACSIGVFGNQV
ncbi:PREDICTED: uncharacterized MFS-type transporter C09D4.1 isoform X1 [Papilio polytes]|uniref:uncharacterized MFS-type transporter C09D4.1 isoform X1 n=1 Tax=Papilio polytes TaxID=76194 RepID=UPI00067614FE|nr:PREDICTED: uncharacterized MFS-type transporter C09D4.1 isoform X1 [Papilio polytes]